MMTIKKVKNHLLAHGWKYAVIIFGIAFASMGFCDDQDPLANVIKPEVEAMFGPHSTIAICIYIAELVLGGIGYVKTKNLLLLIGVPVLVIFTSSMFTYITTH